MGVHVIQHVFFIIASSTITLKTRVISYTYIYIYTLFYHCHHRCYHRHHKDKIINDYHQIIINILIKSNQVIRTIILSSNSCGSFFGSLPLPMKACSAYWWVSLTLAEVRHLGLAKVKSGTSESLPGLLMYTVYYIYI